MKRIIIYSFVFMAAFALPAKGLRAEYPQGITRELAGIHYNRAREHYRRGEYFKAESAFEKVLKLIPNHQGAQWYLKDVKKRIRTYGKTLRGRREAIEERAKAQSIEWALDSMEQADGRQNFSPQESRAKKKEQARLKVEERRRARLEKIQQRKDEKKERLRQKQEAKIKRREQARLKAEERKRARLEKIQQRKDEKKQRQENLVRLKAEKEKTTLAERRRRAEQQAVARAHKKLARQLKERVPEYEVLFKQQQQALLKREKSDYIIIKRKTLREVLEDISYLCSIGNYENIIPLYNYALDITPEKSLKKKILAAKKKVQAILQSQEREKQRLRRKSGREAEREAKEKVIRARKEKQQKIKGLYKQSLSYYSRDELGRAQGLFEEILALNPGEKKAQAFIDKKIPARQKKLERIKQKRNKRLQKRQLK